MMCCVKGFVAMQEREKGGRVILVIIHRPNNPIHHWVVLLLLLLIIRSFVTGPRSGQQRIWNILRTLVRRVLLSWVLSRFRHRTIKIHFFSRPASEGGNSNSPPRVDCNKAAHTLTEGGIQIIISTIIVNPPGQWWMAGWMEATAKVLLLTD